MRKSIQYQYRKLNRNSNVDWILYLLLDISDIEKHFPGLLKATVEWFKIYKIPDGKPENQFAFNGEPKPSEFAKKIVAEVHEYWKKLITKKTDGNEICL